MRLRYAFYSVVPLLGTSNLLQHYTPNTALAPFCQSAHPLLHTAVRLSHRSTLPKSWSCSARGNHPHMYCSTPPLAAANRAGSRPLLSFPPGSALSPPGAGAAAKPSPCSSGLSTSSQPSP